MNQVMSRHFYLSKVITRDLPCVQLSGGEKLSGVACRQTFEGGQQVNLAGSEPAGDLGSLCCGLGFAALLAWTNTFPFVASVNGRKNDLIIGYYLHGERVHVF